MTSVTIGSPSAARASASLPARQAPEEGTTLRAIAPAAWMVTRAGRLAGSIRLDGGYLAFDSEGMLIAVAADLRTAEQAVAAAGAQPLSYSYRAPRRIARAARVLLAGGAAALVGTLLTVAATVLGPR